MGNKASTHAAQRPHGSEPNYSAAPATTPPPPYTHPQVQHAPVPPERNPYYTPPSPYMGANYFSQYPQQPGPIYGQSPYTYQPTYHPPPPPAPQAPVPVQGAATKTIRNPVNLKKSSLVLTPLPDSPQLLALSFSFDASAPCRVTTFLCATEDRSNACRLHGFMKPTAPSESYSKGMGLKFPPPGSDPARHVIDVANIPPPMLLTQKHDTYPVIIRLEALTEAALKEGHSLDEVAPGNPLPNWLQAQTTYAKLVLEQDGRWEVRIVKQTIHVEGIVYDLQEIYGLAPQKEADYEDAEGQDCVICMSERRDTMVLPCRHLCLCADCSKALRSQTHKCPICRIDIESFLTLSKGMDAAGASGSGGPVPARA